MYKIVIYCLLRSRMLFGLGTVIVVRLDCLIILEESKFFEDGFVILNCEVKFFYI